MIAHFRIPYNAITESAFFIQSTIFKGVLRQKTDTLFLTSKIVRDRWISIHYKFNCRFNPGWSIPILVLSETYPLAQNVRRYIVKQVRFDKK